LEALSRLLPGALDTFTKAQEVIDFAEEISNLLFFFDFT
jgi:hypothetical protein